MTVKTVATVLAAVVTIWCSTSFVRSAMAEGSEHHNHVSAETAEETKADATSSDSKESDRDKPDVPTQIEEIILEEKEREASAIRTAQSISYAQQGVDHTLPRHFFRGHILSLKSSISHASGLHIGFENVMGIKGDGSDDSGTGDRAIFSLGFQRAFGIVEGTVTHKYVHVKHTDGWWFRGDHHVSMVRSSVRLDDSNLTPYALVALEIPAYTPMDTSAVFGGVGAIIYARLPWQKDAKISLDFSCIGTMFWYNQPSVLALRFRAEAETGIRVASIRAKPGFNFMQNIHDQREWMSWFDMGLKF